MDADQVVWAIRRLGHDPVAKEPDGTAVFEVVVRNQDAFRSLVLEFMEHAEVLGPADLRADMVPGWRRSPNEPVGREESSGGGPMGRLSAGDRWEAGRWGRLSAGDRPAADAGVGCRGSCPRGRPSCEVAQRFDYPEKELREDLVKVLFVVGLYPFTPSSFMSWVWTMTATTATGWRSPTPDYFSRPLRLTTSQALGLIGSGEALLSGRRSRWPAEPGTGQAGRRRGSERRGGLSREPGRSGR